MNQSWAFTTLVTASALILSGCAGINQLTDGELMNSAMSPNTSQASYGQMGASAAVSQNQSMQLSTNSMASSQAASGNLQIVSDTALQNDPINAPPPPIGANVSQNVGSSNVAPAARPMMLVPPPGTELTQNSAPQTSSEVSLERDLTSPAPLNRTISNDGSVREFVPLVPVNNMTEPDTVVVSSEADSNPFRGREFVPASLTTMEMVSSPIQPGEMPLSRGEQNVIQRFNTLERLLDEGLLTQQEYDLRRSRNIGSLLPYSQARPAAGLEREVPSGDALSSRLAALKRSLEMRAISPRQHAIERNMIMDAILPRDPSALAAVEPRPSDVIEAAAKIGHLERLRVSGLISNEEFEQERAAIDSLFMTGSLEDSTGQQMASDQQAEQESAESGQSTPSLQLGLHLASYRSENAAQSGWNNLTSKFTQELRGLSPVIRRVNLGEARGTFYRLLAAPVTNSDQANSLCQALKRADQYCDPIRVDG